ncbi:hypothetical protein JQ629_09010 [Bradyrhizobium sp. AUGA SZCCT0222]|uniref:hypothetical protein n=1 Tax=Bradyrhizobium sp. AUGA SZCCT0222 TaxID=2807668 RepID=UPI001BA56212|nr:hypothetical protein [Bradyrhizobium sp. AUGA SZCCT0222]MBR1267646.1 hypothetical protein [Bradyrhizobium sp. AUGA SZCCT0222]
MPGLVPGMNVFGPFVIASAAKQSIARHNGWMDCFVASLLAMTWKRRFSDFHRNAWGGIASSRSDAGTRNIFFIIFVDGMFTTFIALPFTKPSQARQQVRAISCVVHAGHAD